MTTLNNNQAQLEQLSKLENMQAESIFMLSKLMQESLDTFNKFVDPMEAYRVGDSYWLNTDGNEESKPYTNISELNALRKRSRKLHITNPYAINGVTNRVSYVYGWGMTYTAVAKVGANPTKATIAKVQGIVDEFHKANKWDITSQENGMRADRDGEVLLRKFLPNDGIMRIRHVEPSSLGEEPGCKDNEKFGIRHKQGDKQTVEAYRVDGEWVDAGEIQHRKRGVDSSMVRGFPTFIPAEPYLLRADKLQHCLSTLSQVQSAIAMIRRMGKATSGTIDRFLKGVQLASSGNESGAANTGDPGFPNIQRFDPGTILNANDGMDYEFPNQGVDPSKFEGIFAIEIRTAAALIVVPEFMLTSDASNANYSSTLAAEGPAVKNFQRIQWAEIVYELELFQEMLEAAVSKGLLTQRELDQVTLLIEGPEIAVRDQKQMAEVAQILNNMGLGSPQTFSAWFSLNYEQDIANREDHDERLGNVSGDVPDLPRDQPVDGQDPAQADDNPDPEDLPEA